MRSKRSSSSLKTRRYSTSSSSSEDEPLIVYKHEYNINSYKALTQNSKEECEFCDEVFLNRYTLYQHNITHMIIPLRKIGHICKLCKHRSSSAGDLVNHMLTCHNKIILNPASQKKVDPVSQEKVNPVSQEKVNPGSQEKVNTVSHKNIDASLHINVNALKNKNEVLPDILKSIVEKQVLVKCDDNINVLVNSKLNKNNKRITHTFESQNDHGNVSEMIQMTNDSIHAVSSSCQLNISSTRNDIDLCESANLNETLVKEECASPLKKVKSSEDESIAPELKEEPFSPKYKDDRGSSPTEDEKESIRHRLLFEEDIEDSLFRNISDECNLNIETLCQEVSLDYDNAISVSDSDDAMSVDTFERLHGSDGLKNDSDINDLGSIINNYNNTMNNFDNGLNNFGIEINSFDDGMNNFDSGLRNIRNFESELNSFVVGDMNTNIFDSGINLRHETNAENNFIPINNTEIVNNFKQNDINMDNFDGNRIGCDFLVLTHVAKDNENATDFGNDGAIHYDCLIEPELSICRFCHKKFPHRFMLIQHEAQHLNVKKKNCWHIPMCCICERYISGNHISLKKHMEKKHPDHVNKSFSTRVCQICGLKYHSYSKHLQYQHGIYKCEKCYFEFDDLQQKNFHECNMSAVKYLENADKYVKTMQLCDLCFSIMKIYMKNRQNYEWIGTKSELGVRQKCEKCNKRFFSVNLVKRFSFRPVSFVNEGPKTSYSGQKTCQMVNFEHTQKVKWVTNNKLKSIKPLTNKERLLKIQNRLKMMKKINKC